MRADLGSNLTGFVDIAHRSQLFGWAADGESDEPVLVTAWIGERLIGSAIADVHRPDLQRNVGFAIALSVPATQIERTDGNFRVEGQGAHGNVTLTLAPTFQPSVAELELADLLPRLPFDVLLRAMALEGLNRGPVQPFANIAAGIPHGELSPAYLPVGHLSADGAVVVGRKGHMFLMSGSNDLIGQYRDERPEVEIANDATSWVRLFEKRAADLMRRGIPYLQTIVPEKSSVLPDCFPFDIDPPTRLFASVERQVAASAMAASYVPMLSSLRDSPDRAALYLGNDTHLSAEGAFFLVSRIVASLGLTVPDIHFNDGGVTTGDLPARFPGVPFSWHYRVPELDGIEPNVEQVELVRGAGMNGTRLVTRNPRAPFDATAMVFGNSYFAAGEHWAVASWWMARLFRDYHFHWSPELDLEAVDVVRPDFVIAQTIERFLPVVPRR